MRVSLTPAAVLAWTAALIPACFAQAPATLTRQQMEEFLLKAKIVKTRPVDKGVTGVVRATLTQDGFSHDACIQTIDVYKPESPGIAVREINFRDTYKHNIAAYKLSLMLGLDMIPPTVERKYGGSSASFTWWVDDVLMDEGRRIHDKINPPDDQYWKRQLSIVHVFDELIYNVDRNRGNILYTSTWRLWMIDHTRAFRLYHTLNHPENLKMSERDLLAKMKLLNEADLKREVGRYLTAGEIKGLLKRRDLIVAFFESKGDSALYTMISQR
jgi:hypothetical protein